MSIYSVQSCISKKITIELSARVILQVFTSQLPIDIPENNNAGYRVNHMFYRISHGALVKKEAGELSLEDGFVAEDEKGRGWTGGLIGGLAGLLGGPVGVLVGMGAGALIGNAADETGM